MDDLNLNNNSMDENEEMEDLGPITLVDENGEEQQFELIDTVRYEDQTFAIMAPYGELDDESDDEVNLVILRMVQEGEDITGLSIRFSLSPAEIRELNNLGENDELKPGQVLKLPADTQL